MPGRCAPARSLSVCDQKLFNFVLELHSGLFYECRSPDCIWTYQLLTSISGKLYIVRRVKSKMAVDELANSSKCVKIDAWNVLGQER